MASGISMQAGRKAGKAASQPASWLAVFKVGIKLSVHL